MSVTQNNVSKMKGKKHDLGQIYYWSHVQVTKRNIYSTLHFKRGLYISFIELIEEHLYIQVSYN